MGNKGRLKVQVDDDGVHLEIQLLVGERYYEAWQGNLFIRIPEAQGLVTRLNRLLIAMDGSERNGVEVCKETSKPGGGE
jgi:hypothetical protein